MHISKRDNRQKGAYRGVHFSHKPFYVIDTAFFVEPIIDINLKWAYYFLLTQDINGLDSGSAIPSTRREDFYALPVQVPPRKWQDSIVALLDCFNSKIELNRQMNQTLEQMAQTLFKSWFIDFDPAIDNALAAGNEIPAAFQAKAALRIEVASSKGLQQLPTAVQHLFPNEFESDSTTILRPKGWRQGTLEDMVTLQRGFDLPKPKRIAGTYPLIVASGQDGTNNEYKVEGPGVVTGRSGKLGVVTFVQNSFWPLNTTLWLKKYTNSNPYHAFYLLKTLDLEKYNAGSAVPTLNRNHVHSLILPIPNMKVIEKYAELVKPNFDKIFHNNEQTERLEKLRDNLLPKLISGELKIPEAEAKVEAALA
jgi:type I restriction enzyme S subunit